MANINRQKICSKKINLLKVIFILLFTIFLMNLSIKLLINFNPIFSSIVAMSTVIFGITYIYNLIIYDMSSYVYNIIDDELIIERITGKASHTFYNIKFSKILIFEHYNPTDENTNISKKYRYLKSNDKAKWYFIEFNKNNVNTKLIFEPDENIIECIFAACIYTFIVIIGMRCINT